MPVASWYTIGCMNTLSRKSFLAVLAGAVFAGVSRGVAQQAATGGAASDASVGSVVSVKGASFITRSNRQLSVRVGNEIFRNDVLHTGSDGTLGVSFDDETSLVVNANTRITISNFVYQSGGTGNAGFYQRGARHHGVLRRPGRQDRRDEDRDAESHRSASAGRPASSMSQARAAAIREIKLYPDQDGTVGRIEVFANDGTRLGQLTQASTGLAVRLDAAATRSLGQPRFAVTPLQIAPIELNRDRAELRQLANVRTVGRQLNEIRRGGAQPAPQPPR